MNTINYINGTIYDVVLATSKKYPKNIAYQFMGKKTTYCDLIEMIDSVANSLIYLGVKEDDIVCIAMPNVPQAAIMLYAVNKIGAIANMIHPLSSENEMKNFLNRVNCKTLLMMDSFYDSVRNIRKQIPVENLIITSALDALPLMKKLPYNLTTGRKIKKVDKRQQIIRWKELLSLGSDVNDLPEISDRTYKTAVILHSGGTTGKIKGVCLTNMNINSCTLQVKDANPSLCANDKMLSLMPLFHGYGLVIGVHLMFMVGGVSVLIPRFTPKIFVHYLLKYKCNFISGVPSLYDKLIQEPRLKKADLSFLKGVYCGADSLPLDLEKKIDKMLEEHNSNVYVRQGYGMTESVVVVTLMPEGYKKIGSIGKPLKDVTLKIIEPGTIDQEVPIGKIGEITFSSSSVMSGYYDDEEETNITLKKHSDGLTYVHSGDLGCVDKEGFIYFKGRIKRMIVTNGYNVFPLDLEKIIERIDFVLMACVVGVPDPSRGEKVKAYVVLKEGTKKLDIFKIKIRDYCRKNIAKYAMPREIEFIDELPMTKVGKIDYKKLIELYTK